tara:strand:- start:2569 stop:3288 length:720 start_codon:yes stop_codon:yes gene_type:complete
MLFISPPFGNYFDFKHTTSIRGSFTLEPRTGLIGQIIKTLRYSYKHGGWVNKIGLRNKGLMWALEKYKNSDDIISIAILNENEIKPILKILPETTNIELNISCPNVDKSLVNNNLHKFLNNKRRWCIIKVSPTCDTRLIDSYYNKGFRQFHCSNTLKIKEGGLSGVKLIPYNNFLIQYISKKYTDVEIIAGGGIYNYNTMINYHNMGAKHFSISTIFFYPTQFISFYSKYVKMLGKKDF